MKEKIKKILKKFPILEKYLRIIMFKNRGSHLKPKEIILGVNNIFKIDKSAILYNCIFDINGNNNEVEISESSILNNVTFYIRGNNNKIKLGPRVRFNRGGLIWIEDYECEAVVGENSSFEDTRIAITEPYSKIIIGKDCMFADGIDLRTGDSHSIIDSVSNERINYAQSITIGNHVWIASHVSILKGVHIADNSVVATRAVVTKSFEENNILIGGIPAKKIKDNINWLRERINSKDRNQQ